MSHEGYGAETRSGKSRGMNLAVKIGRSVTAGTKEVGHLGFLEVK
jgi:hypothetical protein